MCFQRSLYVIIVVIKCLIHGAEKKYFLVDKIQYIWKFVGTFIQTHDSVKTRAITRDNYPGQLPGTPPQQGGAFGAA